MKRFIRTMVLVGGLSLLAMAAAVPAFAIGPGDHSKADENVSPTGHTASCTAQGVIIHNASSPIYGTAKWQVLHGLYAEQCPEEDAAYH